MSYFQRKAVQKQLMNYKDILDQKFKPVIDRAQATSAAEPPATDGQARPPTPAPPAADGAVRPPTPAPPSLDGAPRPPTPAPKPASVSTAQDGIQDIPVKLSLGQGISSLAQLLAKHQGPALTSALGVRRKLMGDGEDHVSDVGGTNVSAKKVMSLEEFSKRVSARVEAAKDKAAKNGVTKESTIKVSTKEEPTKNEAAKKGAAIDDDDDDSTDEDDSDEEDDSEEDSSEEDDNEEDDDDGGTDEEDSGGENDSEEDSSEEDYNDEDDDIDEEDGTSNEDSSSEEDDDSDEEAIDKTDTPINTTPLPTVTDTTTNPPAPVSASSDWLPNTPLTPSQIAAFKRHRSQIRWMLHYVRESADNLHINQRERFRTKFLRLVEDHGPDNTTPTVGSSNGRGVFLAGRRRPQTGGRVRRPSPLSYPVSRRYNTPDDWLFREMQDEMFAYRVAVQLGTTWKDKKGRRLTKL